MSIAYATGRPEMVPAFPVCQHILIYAHYICLAWTPLLIETRVDQNGLPSEEHTDRTRTEPTFASYISEVRQSGDVLIDSNTQTEQLCVFRMFELSTAKRHCLVLA